MQTLDEVQLLLAVQDESLTRTNSALQSFSGDVNARLVTKVITCKICMKSGCMDVCMNDPCLQNDITVLMIAAHDGCTEIASALLEKGAEMNKQDVRLPHA